MRYGNRGRSGAWPGNGPFRDLPPWERPGWLYGPGSCWTLGYWRTTGVPAVPSVPSGSLTAAQELEMLNRQKEAIEAQLQNIQQTLARIEKRTEELQKQ